MEDKQGLWIVSIVAIVAVVALVVLISGSDTSSSDSTGQAMMGDPCMGWCLQNIGGDCGSEGECSISQCVDFCYNEPSGGPVSGDSMA